eukprot:299000-Chlamydomonas_euryale.AAC.1
MSAVSCLRPLLEGCDACWGTPAAALPAFWQLARPDGVTGCLARTFRSPSSPLPTLPSLPAAPSLAPSSRSRTRPPARRARPQVPHAAPPRARFPPHPRCGSIHGVARIRVACSRGSLASRGAGKTRERGVVRMDPPPAPCIAPFQRACIRTFRSCSCDPRDTVATSWQCDLDGADRPGDCSRFGLGGEATMPVACPRFRPAA